MNNNSTSPPSPPSINDDWPEPIVRVQSSSPPPPEPLVSVQSSTPPPPPPTSSINSGWPEPIVRVQSLSDSGLDQIPDRYVKPQAQRPFVENTSANDSNVDVNIPLIDLGCIIRRGTSNTEDDEEAIRSTMKQISDACRTWGFFQVVDHGVRPELMDQHREMWREFFHQPMEVKQSYANSPKTYEGYGSRLGIEKGAVLDWSDYYYLHYLPASLKDHKKWPVLPTSLRDLIEEYSTQVVKLGGVISKILSKNLGLEEDYLERAFGGENNIGACMRVNFYPKCPQPNLTLGLSSHSDPGALTMLLPDADVAGLQVRKDDAWITVKPAPHAFIVNIGDQVQVISNAIYKSVEHRVIVNSTKERVSLAFFYNPKSDLLIQPGKELISPENPPLYQPMTFDEYRLYIRTQGPRGKTLK